MTNLAKTLESIEKVAEQHPAFFDLGQDIASDTVGSLSPYDTTRRIEDVLSNVDGRTGYWDAPINGVYPAELDLGSDEHQAIIAGFLIGVMTHMFNGANVGATQ